MSTILPHMMWPYANLECGSEVCCMRLAEIQNARISLKIAICAPSHNFVGLYIFATKASESEKKLGDIASTCPHNMVNVGPLTAEIGWRVLGTTANFSGFRVLASLLRRPEQVMGRWVMGHGSNGSRKSDGSHGSWVTRC